MKNAAMKHFVHALLFSLLLGTTASAALPAHELTIDVDPLGTDRFEYPVEADIDLTAYMGLIGGALDPDTFMIIETNGAGYYFDTPIMFQFDPDPAFDGATNAVGTLVFIPGDAVTGIPDKAAWPEGTRTFKLLFDVVGGCPDCPGPFTMPELVTVSSLSYENQDTYLIETTGADWYYHKQGGGFASLIDADAQDWISFHDISGSKTAGEYRGIPNLVHESGSDSYFHPGFTNATSVLVSEGPLKVVVRSTSNDPTNRWVLRWDFYPKFSRLTVEEVGTSNGGDYWFLYEGTVAGSMDADDVVVRSDGTETSAFDYAGKWEQAMPDPEWIYFRDTAASRYLFVSNDVRDTADDSYRPQGQTSSSTPEMTVFGFGRVLNTTSDSLVPRMSGVGRTFTVGLGEDHLAAASVIASATRPVAVTIGEPSVYVTAVPDVLPARVTLFQNHPNPFNPRTTIEFTLPTDSHVLLEIFDARGRRVRTLLDLPRSAGPHSVSFDGADLTSGIFLYRLTTDAGVETRKMLLLR